MTPNEAYTKIQDTLKGGGAVILSTYMHATQYGPKHLAWFELRGNDLYVRQGRSWVCANGCNFRFGLPRVTGV